MATLKKHITRAYDAISLVNARKRRQEITKFAKKFGLIYFKSVEAASGVNVVRGMTSSLDQQDSNICIGTHDGYDMVFVERTSSVAFADHPSSQHRWHIMEFDLRRHGNIPFTFVGTKQQSRTFYAKLFSIYRETRHIDTASYLPASKSFQANYTVIASPAEHIFLTQLFTEPITNTMAKNQLPFAIEVYGDSLYVITEATQTNVQSLTKMMHYGLWLAKHIDGNIK